MRVTQCVTDNDHKLMTEILFLCAISTSERNKKRKESLCSNADENANVYSTPAGIFAMYADAKGIEK